MQKKKKGPGIEPICGVSVIWPFSSADLLGLLASEPPPIIFRPGHIPLDHWLTLTYMASGTMYRLPDEIFFLKIEIYVGFPHDSNYRGTERKVCLGPGTEIHGTGNLFC